MVKEKRKSRRMKISVNVSYLIHKNNNDYSINWIKCDLYDVSENGIGLKINQIMLPGDNIKIKIVSLRDEQIIDAVINNVNGQRIGAKFINMNVPQTFLLNRTISNLIFKNKMQRTAI